MSDAANDNHALIPVTALTGFLGADKTTPLKYLLQAEHGMKITVIENEYSETPIDGQLLGVEPVQMMTLSNDYVCCPINTDLEEALFLLLKRRGNGEIDFDHLVIECTGLADPAPVTQTFPADEELCQCYVLDGIITLINTANAEHHLQETIAQAQADFADCILVSKTDLVDAATLEVLGQRLQRINRRALVHVVEHGRIDLAYLLDVRGPNLNADLGPSISLRPLRAVVAKGSRDRIGTLVLRSDTLLDLERLSEFMDGPLRWHDNSLLRYKGVLNIADESRHLVFQGALRLYGFDWDSEWRDDEACESMIVFIGDNLPEDSIRESFERIVEGRRGVSTPKERGNGQERIDRRLTGVHLWRGQILGAVHPGYLRDPHAAGARPHGPGAGIAGRVGSGTGQYAGELLIGMLGRSRQDEDAEALAVIHVEDRR